MRPCGRTACGGAPGCDMARTWSTARAYLIGGGALYLLILVYGLVIDMGSDANFIPLNDADNWLHLFMGTGMIALGLALSRDRNNS